MKGLKKTLAHLGISISKTLFSAIFVRLNQANTTYFSVVVCLRCLLHHILSLIAYIFRENRDFVFITIVPFMMSSNIIRLFVHNTISLSSLCKLIWRHWTYKMPVRYILSSVWVRLSIFSQLSIVQYMGLCVFSLPIALVMTEMIYSPIYAYVSGQWPI